MYTEFMHITVITELHWYTDRGYLKVRIRIYMLFIRYFNILRICPNVLNIGP